MQLSFFISKCLYWLFVYFIHVFSFNWCMRGVLDLIKWRVKLCESKEASMESCRVVKPLPSRHRDVLSRVVNDLHEASSPSQPSRVVSPCQVVTKCCCNESSAIAESSSFMTFQRVAIFSFEQFSCFCHNFLYRCPNAVIQVVMERYSETYNCYEGTFQK